MSPRVFTDMGGKNKLFFLQDDSALWEFEVTNNQIFMDLLQGLKSTLAVRHKLRPLVPLKYNGHEMLARMNPDEPGLKQPEEAKPKPVTNDKESKSDNKLRDALKNYGLVLAIFADALRNEKDWPKDDCAMPQLVVVSNDVETSMQSSSK